jgi:hypothetical protein
MAFRRPSFDQRQLTVIETENSKNSFWLLELIFLLAVWSEMYHMAEDIRLDRLSHPSKIVCSNGY